ncbi:hypothetical protein CHARACLAT_007351 [Characodon lateralis]|uniref:Transmembrane protein n=1 Tax=Characodon lateralis TaxID=208331 RepID=A0ABU7E2J0_9TELE|nr:hypothetical protein [Characodon lateralis]
MKMSLKSAIVVLLTVAGATLVMPITSEIPSLTEMFSNKTEVVLTNTDEDHDYWWMWVFVGVPCLVFILIILLVICVVQSRPCNRGAGEEPIYVNTRLNTPSPRLMLADNLKTVPNSHDQQTPSSIPAAGILNPQNEVLQHPPALAVQHGSCSSFRRGHQQLISSALEANADIDTHQLQTEPIQAKSWLNI